MTITVEETSNAGETGIEPTARVATNGTDGDGGCSTVASNGTPSATEAE